MKCMVCGGTGEIVRHEVLACSPPIYRTDRRECHACSGLGAPKSEIDRLTATKMELLELLGECEVAMAMRVSEEDRTTQIPRQYFLIEDPKDVAAMRKAIDRIQSTLKEHGR